MITRAIQAGRADLQASEAAYDLARVTVVAETIRAYSDACAAGEQLKVASQTLKLQEDTFDLTRRSRRAGAAPGWRPARARPCWSATPGANSHPARRAQGRAVPSRRAHRQAAGGGAGRRGGLRDGTGGKQAMPVGNVAGDVARRRADARAAERRLAAASARIGVATADLYPNISIGGSIGSTALAPKDMFNSSSFRFSVGPLLSFSFPEHERRPGAHRPGRSGGGCCARHVRRHRLTALRDTETALAAYVAQGQRVEALRRGRDQNVEAARIARLLPCRRGTVPDRARCRAFARHERAGARPRPNRTSPTRRPRLFALGGGWQQSPQG